MYSKKYGYVEVEETDKHLKEICNIGNVGDVIIADERNQIVYVTSPVDQKTREFLLAASNMTMFWRMSREIFIFARHRLTLA